MTRLNIKAVLLVWVIACAATIVQAAPFAKTIQFDQPDGTQISLWGQGDDFFAVFETTDGYTVTYDPAQKTYYYAAVSNDGTQLLATNLEVGKGDPKSLGLAQHLRITKEAAAQQAKTRYDRWDLGMGISQRWNELKTTRRAMETMKAGGQIEMSPPTFTTTGVKVGLCLLIDFDDDPASIPRGEIINFCNGDNYTGFNNNGSVKKYYLDNSNNLLTYTNVVTAYIRIPSTLHPKGYYNNTSQDAGLNANRMIKDAIAIMKALPNYTSEILPSFNSLTVDADNQVLACNVFYAGGNGNTWSYGLWPHSWSLYNVGAQSLSTGGMQVFRYQVSNIGNSLEIATFCHENGHMLCGYPDLYDYGYDSVGGAGQFCLMAYGTQNGHNPVQICAYLKYAAGWATTVPVDYKTALGAELTATQGEAGFNRFYRYVKPGTNTEYYLFENRQKSGRDALLPAAGVAIWHIDELGDRDNQSLAYNTTHKNYECTLVQADNLWHFEHYVNSGDANDLFYLGNTATTYANLFSDASMPSARWWDGTTSKMVVKGFGAPAGTMSFSFSPTPPTMLSSGVLPLGRVSAVYSYTLGAVGGVTPYAWSVVSNSLPLGLTLSGSGVINGTPLEETTVFFSIAVTGGNNVAATNQFSLTIQPVHGIPFTETFENGGLIPDSWTQEYVTGALSWSFIQGSPQGYPAAAHAGNYNACLFVDSGAGPVTRLVTPRIDFGDGTHAGQLTFWQCMDSWGGDTDQLRVYYKTSVDGGWKLIETFTDTVGTWTKRTLTLPEPNRTYYIAFEGSENYGYGVCIDDVEVIDPSLPLAITTGSPLPLATAEVFYSQALTAVGGTAPYTFALVDGGLPDGMALSSAGVISGTANAVTTTVVTVEVTDSAVPPTSVSKSFDLAVELPRADLFAEDFEHGGQMPSGWTQAFVTNAISWTIYPAEVGSSERQHPSGPASGDFYALLWSGAWESGASFDQKTRLISPEINLGQAPVNTRLTFWHYMEEWNGDQDELRVFYRTSASSSWVLLATYAANVTAWTQRTLTLPNPSSTYYIAFEGNARFGYGVCIDGIRISDSAEAPIITTRSPLSNGLINMPYSTTLTAVGGKEPYSWAVVSNALPSGLTLNSDGVISGTPDVGGTVRFKVQVVGSDGKASVNSFSLRILDATPIPFLETFENGGSIPLGWTLESSDTSLEWSFRSGSGSGTPSSAYSGAYNACLYVEQRSPHTSWLVSPMLDLGTNTPNTRLTFWHCMKNYDGDQDELRVYYRTTKTGDWTLLATYNTDVPGWTQQTVALPNPSSTYYIAFEGTAQWGYGVCVDDVYVTGDITYAPYQTWKNNRFTTTELADEQISGDLADPDGDGIVNGLEYAMGLDPWTPDTVGLPSGGVSANHLFLTYRENKEATDVTFMVEACTSLLVQDWTTNGVSEILRGDSNTWWQVTARHNVPVTNAPTRFMRLKVYLP